MGSLYFCLMYSLGLNRCGLRVLELLEFVNVQEKVHQEALYDAQCAIDLILVLKIQFFLVIFLILRGKKKIS